MLHDVHAQFAQALVTVLLQHARYRVIRLGIEEIVSEVKSLQTGPGIVLRLPPRLSALPDLLVVDQEFGESLMLEVKFRRRIDERVVKGLVGGLTHQFEAWPEAIAVVLTAAPPGGPSPRYQDHMRLIRPKDLAKLGGEGPLAKRWQALPTPGSVFQRLHDDPSFHGEADRAIAGLRTWVGNPEEPSEPGTTADAPGSNA